MPRASAADAAETARRILQIAGEQFTARGYAAASVDEIARAADVTRGAVYHHYTSKAGLFAAVVAHMQEEVARAVVDAAADAPPLEALKRGSHAFLDAITAGGRARVLLVDAPAALGWDAWRRTDAQASGVHLQDALVSIGIPAATRDATAAVLNGAMNEAALWLTERPEQQDARDAVHAALDRMLDAVASGV